MGSVPADIVNRALDVIGRGDLTIGDLEEGTEGARVALRVYLPSLKQLLRGAHWDFARKMAPLTLLADASGATANVGTIVPVPWVYEYAIPIDLMQARFLPGNGSPPLSVIPPGNIQVPATPQTTASQPPWPPGSRLRPAPFLISTDTNYPVDLNSNWQDTYGTSPAGRTVVLTNIQNAQLVYTCFMPYPSMWPPDFEQAMVSMLAQALAIPLAKDPRAAMAVRKHAIEAAQSALRLARANSANESGFPQSIDNIPDFIRARSSAGSWSPYGPGPWDAGGGPGGQTWCGWAGVSFADGSVF